MYIKPNKFVTSTLLWSALLLLFYVLSFTAIKEVGTVYWVMVACVCALSTPIKDFFFGWSIANQYAESIEEKDNNNSVKFVIFIIYVIALLSLFVFMLDEYFIPDLIRVF